jgi:hypothetical protein
MSAAVQSTRPSLLARVTRDAARLTAPISRPFAGRRFFPLWAVVHHRGRSSGRSYAVPVAIRVRDDTVTIPLPWGDRTQWARNVVVADGCVIRWRGEDVDATRPRILPFDEAADAFHPLQRAAMRAAGVTSVLRMHRHCGA